jgi:L-ascorbate metabolism protein UlaG (beta-lactamase superfamily)
MQQPLRTLRHKIILSLVVILILSLIFAMKPTNNFKFNNLDKNIKPKSFASVIKWLATEPKPKWPQYVNVDSYDIPPPLVKDRVRVSYVGHVTFLIQVDGVNILTDPVWSEYASPFTFAGPKRIIAPGVKLADLPKIDVIVLSHNHYDHMDLATLRDIHKRDQPVIYTSLGNDLIIHKAIKDAKIVTMNWGETREYDDNIKLGLEPAQHWSARGLFDKNDALWGTFLIETSLGHICFIGDSGYNKAMFQNIASKYPNILLSLVPIGAFEPRWFMKDVHMNPEEAVLTHLDLQSKWSIASHFDVFPLAGEEYGQAAMEMATAMAKYGITSDVFKTPKVGQAEFY